MFGTILRKSAFIAAIMGATMNVCMAAESMVDQIEEITELLQQIIDVNVRYKEKFHEVISESTLEQQTPHATLVLCSDSRTDTDIISETPTGEMFVVRNIGNQLATAYGSVEYGVNYLHTKLLVIVGHSGCGAVKAAVQNYKSKSKNLSRELGSLKVDLNKTFNENLVNNVNNQVKSAVSTFQDKVKKDELVIIGMIYDMHNDFKLGNGQLILVNINDEIDPKILLANKYVKDINNLVVLGAQ